MNTNEKDIRISKANTDCVYCEVNNFVHFDGTACEEQYAQCKNSEKTQGCATIDIMYEGNALLHETTCRNCKYYESKRQLTIFDVGA